MATQKQRVEENTNGVPALALYWVQHTTERGDMQDPAKVRESRWRPATCGICNRHYVPTFVDDRGEILCFDCAQDVLDYTLGREPQHRREAV